MATDIRVEPLKEPAATKLQEECRSSIYPAASVRVFPSRCAHTAYFLQYAERFRNFEIREDDVWVASYPKCGKHKYALIMQNMSVYSLYCLHPVGYYYIVIFYNRQYRKFVINRANRTAKGEQPLSNSKKTWYPVQNTIQYTQNLPPSLTTSKRK
jgi:hypothetical protein